VSNRFYVRRFLNQPGHHGGGYLLASVEDTSRADDPEAESWIEFELADCSRRISLEFPLRTRRDRRNSLRKARLLADVVSRFVAALEQEADLAERRERSRR
jgi:hypothetical protein